MSKYIPTEWDNELFSLTNLINVYVFLIILFLSAGWKIGLVSLGLVFFINYICRLIYGYKYEKREKEFKKYIASGRKPYLIYTKDTEPIFTKIMLVVDDKLSVFSADKDSLRVDFYPVIVFLSDKSKTKFMNKYFFAWPESQKFYKTNIARLPSCKPTYENLAVIREVLQQQQAIKDEEYIEETQKMFSLTRKSKRRSKK